MKKTIQVEDQYRTNELSTIPGGVTVTVHYSNNCSKSYDKVKYPEKFINKIYDNAREKRVAISKVTVSSESISYTVSKAN